LEIANVYEVVSIENMQALSFVNDRLYCKAKS